AAAEGREEIKTAATSVLAIVIASIWLLSAAVAAGLILHAVRALSRARDHPNAHPVIDLERPPSGQPPAAPVAVLDIRHGLDGSCAYRSKECNGAGSKRLPKFWRGWSGGWSRVDYRDWRDQGIVPSRQACRQPGGDDRCQERRLDPIRHLAGSGAG